MGASRRTSAGTYIIPTDDGPLPAPSVTTILGAAMAKPALTNWAAKSVAEYAVKNLSQLAALANSDSDAAVQWLKGSPYRQRDRAADAGSAIHAWAEAHSLGAPLPDVDEELRPFLDGYVQFLDDFQPTYEAAEATIYHDTYRYAGTLDAIVTMAGRTIVLDYKTGKGVYPEVSLQLAAYRHATHLLGPDGKLHPMPPSDGAAVLHLTRDGYRLIPVESDETIWRTFLYAQQIYLFVQGAAKTCLGSAITAPETQEVA